ncbi:MAG TPA: hypothetical protein VGO46_19595 [Gemmatimonadaceae bacterium]|nr:hypothetical protein [Gemmatimonadaceae bacterium]
MCITAALLIPSRVHAQRTHGGDRSQSNRSAPGAHYDACKLLSIADVTPILGDGATQELTQGGQNCEFRSADKKQKLFVRTPESTRTEPEVTFKNYRDGPHHNYTIADEKDLGDEAVSAITPAGVEIMALKQHRILYIQDYGPYGSKGTSESLNKLRPIAKKAASAF